MVSPRKFRGKALVLGAGGFIGSHMVERLKTEGYWVRGVDLKAPEFSESNADEFIYADLRDMEAVREVLSLRAAKNLHDLNQDGSTNGEAFDEVYQFAADMGGAEYIFTGENDADILHNSSMINLNVLRSLSDRNAELGSIHTRVFYPSSACVYPERSQADPRNPDCRETSVYPAEPDSEYGWEKLFSERLYFTYARNYGIPVYVARYHNVFGPNGTWEGGREKAPAAICRKIAELPGEKGSIEIWGDGEQTRSFLFIDECIEATRRLIQSDFRGPVNIGSEEMLSINQLVDAVAEIAGKKIEKRYKLDGPLGVRGRNSQNDLLREKLKWDFKQPLKEGLRITYKWIEERIHLKKAVGAPS